jgi:hypothetical protein
MLQYYASIIVDGTWLQSIAFQSAEVFIFCY